MSFARHQSTLQYFAASIDHPPVRFEQRVMSEFKTIANVGDIPEGEGRSYPVNGTMVGVFLVEGEYFAINDFCPHMGASLASGYLQENQVTCPWHAWRFCVKEGTWLDNPKAELRTATYPIRIEGDEIQVSVPPPPEKSDDTTGE